MHFVWDCGGSRRLSRQKKVPIHAQAGSAIAGNRGRIGVRNRHTVAGVYVGAGRDRLCPLARGPIWHGDSLSERSCVRPASLIGACAAPQEHEGERQGKGG
jgi:hypothetical protein